MSQHEVMAPPTPSEPVALRHQAADRAELPPAEPKPTSLTHQLESTLSAWSDSTVNVGIWECEPGEFTADRTAATEVCQILSGSAVVTGEDGTTAHVGPGSLLVLPHGWRGRWLIEQHLRKTFVLISASA